VSLREGAPKSIISEPSLAGAVQIPPDGQPIILLVEQTVGGYAKIATVISADLPKVAQARPDHEIRFRRVDISEGHAAYKEMENRLAALRVEIKGKE
jgi:allophanate hydrolase subunit 2